MKILLPILIIASISACSDLFNKNNKDQPTLHFTTTAVEGNSTVFNGDTLVFQPIDPNKKYPQQNPPFETNIDKEQIKITGYFMSPCANWEPIGTIISKDNTINILVELKKEKVCATMPAGVIYQAYISDISKANYSVTIIHQGDILRSSSNEQDTVFTKEFVIK